MMSLPTNRSAFSIFAGLLALVMLAVAFEAQTASAAANHYVDDSGSDTGDCSDPGLPCRTITYAISQADPGDTINVEAGVYNETVTVNKALTFLGVNDGIDARTRGGAEVNESNVTNGWFIEASDVTIDGFLIKNAEGNGGEFGVGIDIAATTSGHSILNNIIRDNGLGIYLNGSDIMVSQNVISSNNGDLCVAACAAAGNGIYSDQGTSNVIIDNNAFSDHASAWINLLGEDAGAAVGVVTNITISNNEALEDGSLFLADTSFVSIEDNVINVRDDNDGFCCAAIFLGGSTFETDIVRNDITGTSYVDQAPVATPPDGWTAINVKDDQTSSENDQIFIAGNRITGADFGIAVEDNALLPSADFEASFNRIAGNTTYGVFNADNFDIDANNNWWGCNEGPTNGPNSTSTTDCDSISAASVDADDWLVLTLTVTPSSGAPGQSLAATADLTKDDDGNTPTPDPSGGPILDGTEICFEPAANFDPDCDGTTNGVANSTFSSATPGTFQAHAVLDFETVASDSAAGDRDDNEVTITVGTDNDGDGDPDSSDPDDDNDGDLDGADNCPLDANPDQENNDGDALGDVCDPDDDNDTVADVDDNCPVDANTGQEDSDGDSIGNACETDGDNDGVDDVDDNCPTAVNPGQDDTDGDGDGDACDTDDDDDGVADASDNCPLTRNGAQADLDSDGEGDACDADDDEDGVLDTDDNCSRVANSGQEDLDEDGRGDACDLDDDGDLVLDTGDNCPLNDNPGQENNDGDGQGDVCDPDDDNDGFNDVSDNCPVDSNAGQANLDGDSQGDVCDQDDDNDGTNDVTDNCPITPNPNQVDRDNDGIGSQCDPDKDGDSVPNGVDNCPNGANPGQVDSDNDGIGNRCDRDVDGDGVQNGSDNCKRKFNPLQEDNDGDGFGNICDRKP